MKKLIITLILLFTGCSKNIIINNPVNIKYNDTVILNRDFEKIIMNLNLIKYDCNKEKKYDGNKLMIVTNNYIYNFVVSEDHKIEVFYNGNYCNYVGEEIEILNNYLKDIEFKYNNDSFYNIDFIEKYNENINDFIIKIDKNDSYLIINSIYDIYNLRLNEIDNKYNEINLLYEKDFIKKGKILIRKKDIENIKISFETEYNYLVTIIPTINNETIEYRKTYKQKNS